MPRRPDKRTDYLAGHQRSWVWGRHAVTEILDAGRWPMLELYLEEGLPGPEQQRCVEKARVLGAETHTVSRERLRTLCGAPGHQGYLARMGPFPYATLDEVLTAADTSALPPFYLVLDALRDPHNFGAIVRSAAALNATAIIVGIDGQTPVNNHVARSSAGAVNRVLIAQTDSLCGVVSMLKQQGARCIASEPRAPKPVWACDLTHATILVAGNEGAGIRPELVALCDERITVPCNNNLDSFNVLAATSVILYEAFRQRQASTPPRSAPCS